MALGAVAVAVAIRVHNRLLPRKRQVLVLTVTRRTLGFECMTDSRNPEPLRYRGRFLQLKLWQPELHGGADEL